MNKGNFKLNINFDGGLLKVEYNLIESKIEDNILYGFKVKSTEVEKNIITKREFLDFTKDLNYAEQIFEILIQNIVLPLNLVNVLDDLIA